MRDRAVKPLALIDLLRGSSSLDDTQIATWVEREITGDVIQTVRDVIHRYLDDSPHDDVPRETLLDHAERDLIVQLEGVEVN